MVVKINKEFAIDYRWNTENTIFKICVQDIPETGEYMAAHKDIVGKCPTNLVSGKNKNHELDSAYIRSNGSIENIEHHSSINNTLIKRNMEYAVSLHRDTNRFVYPNIFYTGDGRISEVEYLNEKTPLHINVKYSKDIDSGIVLNNIKCKNFNNELINNNELLDFIWLPKSSFNISTEDMVVEMINTSRNMRVFQNNYFTLKQILYLWADKYIVSENLENYKKVVNMSSMELPSFEETAFQSKMARMRRIGFKDGQKEGFKDGQKDLVENLLKHYDALKVSRITGLDLSFVKEVENSK